MTIKLSSRLAPVAVAALLCAPAAAFAQTNPMPSATPAGPGSTAAGPQGAAPTATPPTAVPQTAAQRVEQRIQELHAELHITPGEQQQWQKFAEVMRSNARDMDAELQKRQHQFGQMNAVDNLKSYQSLAEKHAQHLKRLTVAFDDLYGKLTPEQKKLADNEFRAKTQARAEQREQQMQSGGSAPHGMPSAQPQR